MFAQVYDGGIRFNIQYLQASKNRANSEFPPVMGEPYLKCLLTLNLTPNIKLACPLSAEDSGINCWLMELIFNTTFLFCVRCFHFKLEV